MSGPAVKIYRYPVVFTKQDGTQSTSYKTVHRKVAPPKTSKFSDSTIERCIYWYEILNNVPVCLKVLKTEGIILSPYAFRKIVQ